jgi:hypothetical protein
MEDREEIIKALKVIQNTCKSTTRCSQCPLGTNGNDCVLQNQSPENWNIGEETEVWRALSLGI